MPIIEFKNVYKNFQDGEQTIEALKPTNISVEKGELVAIVGPSGSGKSTFLTLMGSLQRPSGGEIKFMGEEISKMSEKERASLRLNEIGFILQTSNLIPFLTIENQFKFIDNYLKKKLRGRKKTRQEKFNFTAETLMKDLGIYHRKKLYPEFLSGGEKQRVAIARALYTNPKLLLADEPTSNLDTEKAIHVIRMLSQYTKDSERATVLVTHDERLLSYCDKVYNIVDGVLSSQGKFSSKNSCNSLF